MTDQALEVRGLTVHYGPSPVLWDIDVSIPRGHVVGIMGPNGAGKTTFIRAVLGLARETTGSIRLLNHRLDVVRKKIAYVPQRGLVDWNFPLTVRGLVEMGIYPRRGLFHSIREADRQSVERALAVVDLSSISDVPISQLSGGQRQRAFLARALAQEAELYFLDEPFEGVDQVSEQILVDVIRSMKRDGKTFFIVHHDLVTAGRYFDWGILLNTRLVASGTMHHVFTFDHLRQTYGKNLAFVDEVVRILQTFAEGRTPHG